MILLLFYCLTPILISYTAPLKPDISIDTKRSRLIVDVVLLLSLLQNHKIKIIENLFKLIKS